MLHSINRNNYNLVRFRQQQFHNNNRSRLPSHNLSFKVPMSTNLPQQSQQLSSASLLAPQQAWHSGWSPYQYEVCLLPNSAKKCYGCNQDFADKYRQEPHNVVIRHTDRRIRGKDLDGNIQFNSDFTHTYYHCNIGHVS